MRRLLALLLPLVLLVAPARADVRPDPLGDAFGAYGDTGEGWTGGDTAYSVDLGDGRRAWLFSDTFLGPVNEDGSRPTSAPLINNSIVVQDGSRFSTVHGRSGSQPAALLRPAAGYYWLGDGTREGDRMHVFALHFVAAPFVFQQIGVALATLRLPSLEVESVEPFDRAFVLSPTGTVISYGAAVTETAAFTYVWGIEDLHVQKFVHLARAPAGDLRGAWEYWTGSGWSPSPLLSARIASGISNEFSVHREGERWVMVAQDRGIGADVIAMSAPDPEGPWGGWTVLYRTPEPDGEIFTYNAKAHPDLGPPGSILVTYNVNTTDFFDLYRDVTIYRPRFVDVPRSALP